MQILCDDRAGSVWRVELRSSDDTDAALDGVALEQLELLLDDANAGLCRVLVLAGSEGRFCRGMSLTSLDAGDEASAVDGVRRYARCLSRLRGGRPAVIAVVDGPALGGGLGLAAAADVLIATARASFGLPEAMVGLVPAMVLPLCRERVTPQKVRRLALGLPALDVEAAERWGLVDLVVEDRAAADKALFVQLKQLLRLAPDAVAQLRDFSARSAGWELSEAIASGAEITAASVTDEQVLAGVRAFVSGEPPPWHERPKRKRVG
jgi:enoyl-CoA hydratase/carnithine racemase